MRTLIISLALAVLLTGKATAADLAEIKVWKNPSCGCCNKWISHLRQAGFEVVAYDIGRVDAVRAKLGMPQKYASCHTAKVGDYVIEGHVPATDIKRLLGERPTAKGLAVPGMPVGSPGMEGPYSEPYQTLLVGPGDHAKVFAEH